MNRLKEIRKEKKITLKNLSKDLGIPRSTLSRYENENSEPKQETWEKIANFFNVSVGYLMGVSDQRVSDEYALKVAKEIYFDYLSDDELSEYDRKALEYFNNEHLDDTLQQIMTQYFSAPIVLDMEELQTLKKTHFLRMWLDGKLIDIYRKEVKTNQNLISNIYYKIPDPDEVYSYAHFEDIQIRLTTEMLESLEPILQKETINELGKLSKTTLVANMYESAINDSLKDDIEKILDEAHKKLNDLKKKYPDKESMLKQITVLISDYKESNKTLIWSRTGDEDYKDELPLSEVEKQVFVKFGSVVIEEFQKVRDQNKE